MKESFAQLSKIFFSKNIEQQRKILSQLYCFSPETKVMFLTSLGYETDGKLFVDKMQRETIDKVFRNGRSKIPNSRVINQIINKAKKVGVLSNIILDLELLAYRGFVEFLHKFGGGPDHFDQQATNHLDNYLMILMKSTDKIEMNKQIEQLRNHLTKHDNLYTDSLDEVFEKNTGIKIKR